MVVLLNTISSAKENEKAQLEWMEKQRNTETGETLLLGTSVLRISNLRIFFFFKKVLDENLTLR